MTVTETTETTPQAESPVYTVKVSAVTAPAPAEPVARQKGGRSRDWVSGWCGPGPCNDGRDKDSSGAPIHRCVGMGKNGEKVAPRYIHCTCLCHTTNPLAVAVVPADERPENVGDASSHEVLDR